MLPLNAPFPTAWNLPFQFAAGIQTSTLMSESGDGVSVMATRQNDGSDCSAFSRSGGLNAPASTFSAAVIVPFESFSLARSAHAAPASRVSRRAAVASTIAHTPPITNFMAIPFAQQEPDRPVGRLDRKHASLKSQEPWEHSRFVQPSPKTRDFGWISAGAPPASAPGGSMPYRCGTPLVNALVASGGGDLDDAALATALFQLAGVSER